MVTAQGGYWACNNPFARNKSGASPRLQKQWPYKEV
jgi:hypothetical protein